MNDGCDSGPSDLADASLVERRLSAGRQTIELSTSIVSGRIPRYPSGPLRWLRNRSGEGPRSRAAEGGGRIQLRAAAHTRSLQTPLHRPASMGLGPLVVETGASSARAKARLRGDEAVSHPRRASGLGGRRLRTGPRPGSAKMEPHSSDRCHSLKRRFASLL